MPPFLFFVTFQLAESRVIENIQKIRNISICHIQGNNNFPPNASLFTRRSFLSWEPIQLSAPSNELPRLANMKSFGKFNLRSETGDLIKQIDLELPALKEIHSECKEYLVSFDSYCVAHHKHLAAFFSEI